MDEPSNTSPGQNVPSEQPSSPPGAHEAGAAGGSGRQDGGGSGRGAGDSGGGNGRSPTDIDEVIYKRDLHEVFLLIDFISGRSDKNLNDLRIPDPKISKSSSNANNSKSDSKAKELSPGEVVTEISKLGYPPPRPGRERAEGAALLLLAKDKLTELASPARGLTIGYTAMFLSSRKELKHHRRMHDREIGISHRDNVGASESLKRDGGESGNSQSASGARVTLALVAFGIFIRHVITFKFVFKVLVALALILLLFVACTYWDVATGQSILQRIDDNAKIQTEVLRHTNFKPDTCLNQLTDDCVKWNSARNGVLRAERDLYYFVGCSGLSCYLPDILRWAFMLCRHEHMFRPEVRSNNLLFPGDVHIEKPYYGSYLAESIGTIITVFSNYILPVMFGLLGAIVAVIRTIQYKTRESLLGPRDLVTSLIGVPIGLVAGVAVGLFYSPSTIKDVAGSINLTTSTLGFLAGYGAEKFFASIDNLLAKIFPLNLSNNPAGSATNPRRT